MRSLTLIAACLAIMFAAPRGADARPLLLVSAEASGEIVVVDPAKAQVVGSIKVGVRPRGLKLAPTGRRLLVALGGAAKPAAGPAAAGAGVAGLAVVDIDGRKVAKVIVTAPSPFGVDVLPDGRTAYLSNSDTNEVSVIDLEAGAIKKKIAVGMQPQGLSIRPDGKVVYVATHGSDEVSALDPKTMTLLGRIDAGSRPQTILVAPRGDLAAVTDEGLPSITIVDTKRNTSKEMFVLQPLAKKTPPVALQSAVFSPDGKLLYVTTGAEKSVLIVDLGKKAATGTIEGVGGFPRGIAISRDGKKLYTANGPSNDLAIIDLASKKVSARVAIPGGPWGVVLLP